MFTRQLLKQVTKFPIKEFNRIKPRQLLKQVTKFPIKEFNRIKPRQLSEYARKTIKHEKPKATNIIKPVKATKAKSTKINEPVDRAQLIETIGNGVLLTGTVLGGGSTIRNI
jgi:hypothetical protein